MAGLGPTIVFRSGVPALTAVPIVRSMTVLGKHPTCDIVLANPFVSRQHARIDLVEGGAVIRDLSSKNGTFVNGTRIRSDPAELAEGSMIEFGRNQVTAVFHLADSTVTLDILALLNSKRGQVCSHAELARAGWPERQGGAVDETEIRQYVRRIRVRFDLVQAADTRITTLRGSGYRLDVG